jgi:hypothetical protein
MHKTPEITRLIHDNFSMVISFAFGLPVAAKVIQKNFAGEWKYLQKNVFGLGEIRADRALLEMATQLRALDDQEKLSHVFKQSKSPPLGTVTQEDGTNTDMHFRDFTNKIIHATAFEWNFAVPEEPVIICHPPDGERWRRAEIKLIALMGLIGSLGF